MMKDHNLHEGVGWSPIFCFWGEVGGAGGFFLNVPNAFP
jgi:hypothetical protein